MRLETRHPKPWHEAARFGTAALWVVVLSVWLYPQLLWIYAAPSLLASDALSVSSAVLRTYRPLWFACFFPALAFGLACYVVMHRRPRTRTAAVGAGLDRLTAAQTTATLCIALCVLALSYRLLVLAPLITDGKERVSSLLLSLHAEWWADFSSLAPVVERHVLIGALAAVLAATQAWGLLPRLGGSRARLVALLGVLLVFGGAMAWLGGLERVASYVPRTVFEIDRDAPILRGLLLDDPAHRATAVLHLERYLATHVDDGRRLTLGQLEDNAWGVWPDLPEYERAIRRCELCLLPGIGLFAAEGLPVRLAPETVEDGSTGAPGPILVLEIPRGARTVRVDWIDGGAQEVVPLDVVSARVGAESRVVAKIDFLVQMAVVRDLLADLRDAGVRRVDLAAIAYGYRPLPNGIPLLTFDREESAPVYEPRLREHPWNRDRVVVVKKYVPPPGMSEAPDPRPKCGETDWLEVAIAHDRYELEPEGSLPERVTLSVDADLAYGEFVGLLQAVLAGGPESIGLVVADEADSDGSGTGTPGTSGARTPARTPASMSRDGS